jgi:two-component system, NtrC family, response regulator HydG
VAETPGQEPAGGELPRPATRAESVAPAPVGEERYAHIVGQSVALRRVFTLTDRAAQSDVTVLLTGETGTGKEMVACTIHAHSNRSDRPFVVVNCGALSEHLQESELFGHRRGAFTDAVSDRDGLFAAADGGVLFLDEIGDTAPGTQVRLLRALQEGEIRRVGDDKPRKVDVRLICATNRRLEDEVASGRFREDLYYRLFVLAIELPPLRERIEDIPLLADHFMADSGTELLPETVRQLQSYGWPGNIRELENQIRSAQAVAGHGSIQVAHLWPRVQQAVPVAMATGAEPESGGHVHDPDLTLRAAREDFERRFLLLRLQQQDWQLEAAARSLGLSRSRLYELVKRYGLRSN